MLLPAPPSASTERFSRDGTELDGPWVCSSTASLTTAGEYRLRLFFQASITSNSCPAGHSVPSFHNTKSPRGHDGEQMPGPPMQTVLERLCGGDQLWAALELLPTPTALQPPGRDPILPKLSPLLGHSEHPERLAMCQESAAGWCCASIPGQHCVCMPGWHCTF